ncbi:carbohydrate kinase family protein [Patescibacteria group bacterium]|nr:carbohydrate kinase family protein [Patescibacteria group bacterium]
MAYDILTIGGIMRDIIFLTTEGLVIDNSKDPLRQRLIGFELGAKIYVKKVYFEPGGGASNTAVGFSKLGLKTAIMGRVGQDREGDQLIKGFKNNKIDTHLMQVDKKKSTGFSFILGLRQIKRAHSIFAYRGTNDSLIFKAKASDLKNIKWFYVSSVSSSNWPIVLDKAFSFAKKGVKIAWNPSNVQLKAGYKKLSKNLKQTNILILNEDEARELVLSKKKSKNLNIRYLLKEISEMGPNIVAITVGKKGVYAYDEKKVYYQKPAPSKVINATGAGDSFSAAFVASLFYQPENIQRALKWGVFNSASVIDQIGAQKGLLSKKQISLRAK